MLMEPDVRTRSSLRDNFTCKKEGNIRCRTESSPWLYSVLKEKHHLTPDTTKVSVRHYRKCCIMYQTILSRLCNQLYFNNFMSILQVEYLFF